MGRIEYEYPLFKVYYSNNSNNLNIRGNPATHPPHSAPSNWLSTTQADLKNK